MNDPKSQFYLSDLGGGDILLIGARREFPAVPIIDNHPIVGTIVDFLLPAFLQCPDVEGWGTHACGVGEDLLLYISPILKGPNVRVKDRSRLRPPWRRSTDSPYLSPARCS